MAKLYKFTTYICDLDETPLSELKHYIDDGLDNMGCRGRFPRGERGLKYFNNEKIGPSIGWDDNIDINMLDSTTEQWEEYFYEG